MEIFVYFYYVIKVNDMIELHNVKEFQRKLAIKQVSPKKDWPMEAKMNNNIYRVVFNEDKQVWEHLTIGNQKYADFLSKVVNSFDDIEIAYAALPYEQIVHIPEDTVNDQLLKMQFFGDVLSIKSEKFSLILHPFMNGAMIYGINVMPEFRNKGIGTDIINKLYDISEDNDFPLYLTPYPDDESNTSQVWEKVNRLRNWYNKLGFGPIFGNELIYSNFEDDDVLDLINNHKIKFN